MRLRLFALLAAPLMVLAFVGTQLVLRVSDEREAAEAAAFVVEITTQAAEVDAALGNEVLVAVSSHQQIDSLEGRSLSLAESRTDVALNNLERRLLQSPIEFADQPLYDAIANVRVALTHRNDLSAGWVSPLQMVDRYRIIRQELVDAIVQPAAIESANRYSNELIGLISLVEARSAHLDERVSLDLALRYAAWAPGQHSASVVSTAAQADLIQRAVALARAQAPDEAPLLSDTRDLVLTSDDVPSLTRGDWRELSDSWLGQLDDQVAKIAERIERRVTAEAETAARTQRASIAGIIIATAIALLAASISGVRLVRRVRRIARAAGELSIEDTPITKLNDAGSDEIADMANAFDRMSDRIREASVERKIEARVLAAIVSEQALDQTLTDCARLLPDDHSFELDGSDVLVVLPSGAKTGLDEALAASALQDDQLALSLARMAQWRSQDLQALRHRAAYDALTGLLNRATVLRELARLCEHGRPAVIYLDLDNFKRLNDSRGHEQGDTALEGVAEALKSIAEATGSIAGRIGGDEFIVVYPDYDDLDELRRVGLDIISAVNRLDGFDSTGLTASVGIAPNRGEQSAEELLHEADAAMYRAKGEGRHGVVIAEESIRREIEQLHQVQQQLATALANEDFSVAYQGIWDSTGTELVALEALARWTDQGGASHPPSLFFAVAERTGRAHEIDQLILRQVARHITEWQTAGLQVPPVHVNVSAQALNQPNIVSDMLTALADFDCEPSNLVAEITESALISEIDAAGSRLEELRRQGIRIAVDDFGEGYSSLRYLSKLPIDVLKIDRQFIDHIDQNPNNQAIVRAVANLADTLQMTVVAEGVERSEEHDLLVRLGCGQLQGFLLHKPVGPALVVPLLQVARTLSSAGAS